METGPIPDVKKIAILRALVLGDLIFILPAIESLRRAYPQAEFILLARPWAKDFVENRFPGICRVITFRSSPHDFEDLGYLIHPEDAEWFFPQMQAEGIDIAISMQGGGVNGIPFLKRMNPRVTIATREPRATEPDRWLVHDFYQNEVIRGLELSRLAGGAPADWTPRLPVLPCDREAAAEHLSEVKRPYVVLHAGARDIRRCWPTEKYAALGDALIRRYGVDVVLTGTSVDAKAALQVEQQMQETPVNLSHQLSLSALIGVLEKAALVISNDTGVLHVGLAVGAKAIGIYWSEYISKSMPLSRESFFPLIAWNHRCPVCGTDLGHEEVVRADLRECMHLVSFVDEITPEQVLQIAGTLLTRETG